MKKINSRTKKPKLISLLIVVGFALIGTFALLRMFAATNQVILTSSAASVKKDDTFFVDVTIDSGDQNVFVAQADIKFDPSKVAFVSPIDVAGSAFASATPETIIGENHIQISRYNISPKSGNLKLAKLNFKVIADSGTIPITVDSPNTHLTGGDGSVDIYNGSANSLSIPIHQTGGYEPTQPSSVILTPNKTQVNKDETFNVSVNIDSGAELIDTAGLHISFDPQKVQFVGPPDYSQSGLASSALDENTEGHSGYVNIARYSTENQPSGNFNLANLTFKAIASDDASFSVDISNSSIYKKSSDNNTDNIIGTANSPKVNIVAPVVPPPPPPPPPPTEPAKPPIVIGKPIVVRTKPATSTGKKIVTTDYSLNGNYVGTTNGNESISIPTDGLPAGNYKLRAHSTAEDGSTEDSSEDIKLKNPSILSKLGLPVAISASVILIAIVIFAVKMLYKQAVPFYKTLG